jgi:hypothetical protein
LSSGQFPINVFGATDARNELHDWLKGAGFDAVKQGDNTIDILGKVITGTPPMVDGIKTITVTITDRDMGTPAPLVGGNVPQVP